MYKFTNGALISSGSDQIYGGTGTGMQKEISGQKNTAQNIYSVQY